MVVFNLTLYLLVWALTLKNKTKQHSESTWQNYRDKS